MIPLAVAAVAVGVWWLSREPELFCVVVRRGRARVVRGKIPAGLRLGDIEDIVGGPPTGQVTVKAITGEGSTRLVFSGNIDESRRQRLRNVFALCPASKLRRA